ncbi:DUF2075 domain-containing protein [Patescibacteria group bacterium]|nr:DUF2075 domain-containing protein [Patescibacteria group bacterium]
MEVSEIPGDVGIAIEYKIPSTSKRIDFIITGKNEDNKPVLVLIELKQWSKSISVTNMDGIVNTEFYGDVEHPSYQAWSYATLLEDYNSEVQEKHIFIEPCAYLHNYQEDNVIKNDFYKEYTKKAPVFFKSDCEKLQNFIKKFVKYGDNKESLYSIENGKIRPSKALADSLAAMLKKNKKEFILIDDQKIVYEKALQLAKLSTSYNKNVLIVRGGPGTGKSVVAINLLSELINKKTENNVSYVTKNAAPRRVFQVKLSGVFTHTRISNLFRSSDSFLDLEPNIFDTLIIDEAHRITKQGGFMGNLGENQIMELIKATKFSIFFIDEDQRVTLKDIGRESEISNWAKKLGANVNFMELASQFRCSGDDGYLPWLDNLLQIKETANETLEGIDYDFKIFDDVRSLHNEIIIRNKHNNKSRIVAGYCWKWISKRDPGLKDIVIGDYQATWNLTEHGQAWLVHPESVTEVGCIHTCQGLDLDYVGVIIGADFIIREGKVVTDPTKRAITDRSLRGLNGLIKESPIKAGRIADSIIKNTYRTLMTRGMNGCYIYCVDPETQQYFKDRLSENSNKNIRYGSSSGESISLDK